MTDALHADILKLENLSGNGRSKAPPIQQSLDALLESLYSAKAALETGSSTPRAVATQVQKAVEGRKKDIDDRQKEIYGAIGKMGKNLDKKFPNTLPDLSTLFTSPSSVKALENTVATHLIRTEQFDVADVFHQETGTQAPLELRTQFQDLHRVLTALRERDVSLALQWAIQNREFLESRSSPLEFHLRRSEFISLLLSPTDPNAARTALSYLSNALVPRFFPLHKAEIFRMSGSFSYLPIEKLKKSPYAAFMDSKIHDDLEPAFVKEFCARIGQSRSSSLKVVGDIGGGGALVRIEKGRKVMKDRKSEWNQADELLIEIPLPPENRYHSIFACPVSKEQSTETNHPMMMSCGHVLAKESLTNMAKPGGRVKCPYCPIESSLSSALRVYF
ncbi:hypothetical protein SISNIDRAFT_448176 [Sistotremastrum niveocremeum HHB9708]|uniref:GID complex catalytic subunit 2 n=2 Tax=Sistotremastraceae TaxID=3402574 RepID=A0A165AMM0_9AGAM|nr:hypothetical protein SISNIDRAFT_448176 [Sistotremastrum niveocremeum HHB9708]KZT42117.1 hypothetical protein SISSUDRAFT_1042070 [Sistotremastrum suecicum HHB10207 ss-3]